MWGVNSDVHCFSLKSAGIFHFFRCTGFLSFFHVSCLGIPGHVPFPPFFQRSTLRQSDMRRQLVGRNVSSSLGNLESLEGIHRVVS